MQEGDVNPFTKQPHSAQYKKILEVRKKLPVFAQMQEFYDMVSGFRSDHERGRSESASGIRYLRSSTNVADLGESSTSTRLVSWSARLAQEKRHSKASNTSI